MFDLAVFFANIIWIIIFMSSKKRNKWQQNTVKMLDCFLFLNTGLSLLGDFPELLYISLIRQYLESGLMIWSNCRVIIFTQY